MRELKNTKTWDNLMSAFAAESMARNKYTYFAEKAKEDGYIEIESIFTKTADNEKEHAKIWFKLLHDGMQKTDINLADSVSSEHTEWSQLYFEFAKTATEEGFEKIAFLFDEVAKIEKSHEERFKTLLEDLKNNAVFEKTYPLDWICTNCGHTHSGKTPPASCPICQKPIDYFAVKTS
jgi:rubrerythrin